MKISNLMKDGVQLTPIGLGCEQLGGTDWGAVNISDVRKAVNMAWDMGVRVFDTADVYGLGQSEIELANTLGQRRHQAVIVSKFGCRWTSQVFGERANIVKDASASYTRLALEGSLKRLRIEAIPLYLLHWPDEKTPIEETLEVLEKCKTQGKIVSYGVSNFKWEKCQTFMAKYPLSALEGPYSLISIEPGINEYEKARESGLEILTYGPLAQGLLAAKYIDNIKFSNNDRRYRLLHFSENSLSNSRHLLELLLQAAQDYNKTPAQVALRWILDQKFIGTAIVGAKNSTQVVENMGALGWKLDPYWQIKLTTAAKNFRQSLVQVATNNKLLIGND